MSINQKYEMKEFCLLLKMQCHLNIFEVLLTMSVNAMRSESLTLAFCEDGVVDMCPEALGHTHIYPNIHQE